MSTEITGPYRRLDLPKAPIAPAGDSFTSRRISQFRDMMLNRFPALADIFSAERVTGYQDGYRDGLQARSKRELDHITAHPHVPMNFLVALQHGTVDPTAVSIDGLHVTVTTTTHGTGIPEPDSETAWDHLVETVRYIAAQPYCADVITPLPRELASITWTSDSGTVTVTPACSRPTRLRGLAGFALLPLARAGDLLTASTVSASAAAVFAGGALTPVTIPGDAEPLPDLQPKVSASGRQYPGRKPAAPATPKPRPRPKSAATVKVTPRTAAPKPRAASGSGLRAPAQRLPVKPDRRPVELRHTSAATVEITPAGPVDRHCPGKPQGSSAPGEILQLKQGVDAVSAHALRKDR